MNLVTDCIQVVSGKPLSYFIRGQSDLLLRLFRKCFENPAISGKRRELKDIYRYVERNNESLNLWRDCEIYFPLERLLRSREPECFPNLIALMKVLVGMKDVNSAKDLPDGYYRLKNIRGGIFEKRDGKLFRDQSVLWKINGFKPDIYLPKNEIFRDLLEEKFYPTMRKEYNVALLKKHMVRILRHMKAYSTDIWEDFQDAVWNLVLLTNTPRVGVDSMTLGYGYFGGIFFNPFVLDEYSGVEGLIHEYIHTRCWLWWELRPPTGIPPADVLIVSPMTGNPVRVDWMIHALIVYLSALHYYRFVQSTMMPADRAIAKLMKYRALHLSRNLPALLRRLSRKVKKGTDMGRLLEYLREFYPSVTQ